MRNLKRALSLALASVMLLGMMVVGTSAASYPDVDENDNVEAIEVLNAVQVMIGDRGNFRPDAAVNRHEMAVIMAKLVLGNETADNYVGTHPFTDVFPWADKYVAACYENGLVSGTSATTFSGNQPLTAVQAAAMMLRALGYKDLSKGATDWRAPVTAMANQIRLFNGVASNPSQQLNRNQVAQLTLNTLKSPVVTLKDNTFDVSNGDGSIVISGGAREYIVRFSQEDYAYAINDTETAGDSASGIQGATIELGEHLYNGKLQLNNVTDDFGRPSRKWEFNGKTIGTYVKEELMVKEYVGKVTGKDLYDQLGSTIVNDYDLTVTIDGVNQNSADAANAGVFGRTSMDKNNKAAVGRTGTGTLTQVFVDNRNISARKDGQLYIAIINTYLAKASQDYDSKKEELSITIYGARRNVTTGNYVKDSKVNQIGGIGTGSTISNVKLAVEDFPAVTSMKKDDYMLVTVAAGDVIAVKEPEILSGVTISGFKVNSDVVVDGQKYEFTTTAHYKDSDLAYYTGDNNGTINLQDTTYNVYLDAYGNLVGVEEVNPVKNYVFITGSDQASSNYTNKTRKALGLFLDGTTEELTYKTDKGTPPAVGLNNVWCTYTKDSSGVYTLRQVANLIDPDGNPNTANNELAQFNTKDGTTVTYSGDFTIDSKNSTLDTQTATTDDGIIYGRDDTVYLVAELDRLTQTTEAGRTIFGAVKGADTVIVDVKNTDLKVWSRTNAEGKYPSGTKNDWSNGVYALYNDGYGIIAAVVIGEDNGASRKWYNTGDNALLHEDYVSKSDTRTSGDGEWVWTRTLFDENGNEVTLTERGDSASYLKNMNKNQNYLIKLDSKGEVYRAYRLPGDTAGSVTQMPTVAEAGLVGYDSTKSAADNKDAEYVTDPDDIGAAVRAGKNQMLISCDVLNNKMTVSESGVLYVNNSKDSGILVNSDTKIVLIQINRNNRDTYTDGVGFSDVKSIIEGLNETHGDRPYNYKVSAVADKRVAKSIVIWDYTTDWTPGTGSDEGEGTGNVKTALKGSSAEAKYTISKSGILKLNLTYTAPAFAVKNNSTGSVVTMPAIDVYEGTTLIDTISAAQMLAAANNGGKVGADGKATFSFTSNRYDFDEDKVTDPNNLTFKLSGDETLSKVVVRYFEDAAKTKQIDSSVLATDTSEEWGTTAAAASGFKLGFKAGTYKDTTINANSNSITISGMYDTTNDAAYVKGTAANDVNATTAAAFGTTETIKANGTDYVDVVITGLEKADPTYTVTNTDKTDKALSTWRVTGDDADKTLTIAVTGATADGDSEAKSGLNINDSVSGTVTLSAAPDNDGVYGYRVKSTKLGLDTILTNNTPANWSIRVSGNMTISPSDLTVTPVTTLKITDIEWDKGEIRITFNKAVFEDTVTATNFAANVVSGATLTVDVDEANNNVVVIKAAAGKDIAENDTVVIKKEVASGLAGESTVTVAIAPDDTSATTPTDVEVGAVGYTVTLTAGGNATVAKKDA